jgi:2-polyprenyl-3-methyl-5-hydroxy-6-metoxy-1,4-benzoquinol methylase
MDDELVALQRTLYESRNATRRWLHTTRRDWISHAVRKFCPGGERALEIGPGSGIYIPVLNEVCEEVYVTDCERAYLRPLENRYAGNAAVKIDVDDITRSHLPSDHFDLVLCTEVVEHIADSRPAFKHIARVLKPGGVLILSTPQRHSTLELTAKLALSRWLIWLTRLAYREPVLEMGHINLMTDHEVQAQIRAADLTIIKRHKSGLYLPGIAELCGETGQHWAARLESIIRGSRFDGVLWTQYYVVTRTLQELNRPAFSADNRSP